MTTTNHILLQDLIPDTLLGVFVSTENDLRFLGKGNLEWIAKHWQQVASQKHDELQRWCQIFEDIDQKSLNDIRKLARESEHPAFPELDYTTNPPEPIDIASQHRAHGATTFTHCGWCEYCAPTYIRWNYAIEGACQLRPEGYGCGNGYGGEPRFNSMTPCVVASGTEAQLESIKRHIHVKVNLAQRDYRIASERAKLAEFYSKQTRDKPIFTKLREPVHFQNGDRAVVFLDPDHDPSYGVMETRMRHSFVPGKVTSRNPDVTVETNQRIWRRGSYAANQISYGIRRPEILLDWEYEYLLTHPDYRDLWVCQASVGTVEFKHREMLRTLTRLTKLSDTTDPYEADLPEQLQF